MPAEGAHSDEVVGTRGEKGATMKIQRMNDLEADMRKVARGEIAAPADAAAPSVNSTEALIRLLTPDSLSLLRTIHDAKPQSVL